MTQQLVIPGLLPDLKTYLHQGGFWAMTQQLVIPGQLPDLNQIVAASKKHWAKYSIQKKQDTEIVAAIASEQLNPVKEYPVSIEIVWYCKNRRKDKDNVAAGKKFILDGLVKAGILEGDGWKHIDAFKDTFVVDAENPRVEVFLVSL